MTISIIGQIGEITSSSSPIDRRKFASLMVAICSALAGISIVQIDIGSASTVSRTSNTFLAATALISVLCTVHLLAHISGERDQIARSAAEAALFILAGALVSSVFNEFILALFIVAPILYFTLKAAKANLAYVNTNKFRTVSISIAVLLAEAFSTVGLSMQSVSLRAVLGSLSPIFSALFR